MSVVYTNFGGMLVHEDRGGIEHQYVSDTLGSLVGELDSTQALTYTAEYWPYGEVQTETGTNTSPWSFVGLLGYLRDLASLLYARARHYLPKEGRWLTATKLNKRVYVEPPYNYTMAQPGTLVDTNGLLPTRLKLRDCKKRGSPQRCFHCAYQYYRNNRWMPIKACEAARELCGYPGYCGPCGFSVKDINPFLVGCSALLVSLFGGLLTDLHDNCGGGGMGADKLAHCVAVCLGTTCAGPVWSGLWGIFRETIFKDEDPNDVTAEQMGARCAEYGYCPIISPGNYCLDCCARKTRNMLVDQEPGDPIF